MSNPTIRTITGHRSVRSFLSDPLPEGCIDTLKDAMRRGPTSSALQTYTVVFVQDANLKRQLSHHSGNQVYVSQVPLFVVACADLRRVKKATDAREYPYRAHDLRSLIAATEDLTIVVQNASLAAQSLGLGTVMIGGVLNGAKEIAALLKVPPRILPVLGLCVGYAAADQTDLLPRPRLPLPIIFHDDRYTLSEKQEARLLDTHDRELVAHGYYRGRQLPLTVVYPDENAAVPDGLYGWTEHVARKQARHWWTDATPKLFRDLRDLGFDLTAPEIRRES